MATTPEAKVKAKIKAILKAHNVEVVGIVVGVDRQEKGAGNRPALQEIAEDWQVPSASIVTVRQVVSHLHGREVLGQVWIDDVIKARIDDYLATYGSPEARQPR